MKLKEFADGNFEFDENGREFSKRVENSVVKVENCLLPAISPFPTVISKDLCCRHIKEGLFSSPEHNVLRVSYCDRSMSGVRPSIHP